MIDVVPHTQTASILRHHDVTLRYPLDVTGVVENSGLCLGIDVEQMQLEEEPDRFEHIFSAIRV